MKTFKKDEKNQTTTKRRLGDEAWQNWLGFWNLILQENIKQNPHLYKKPNKTRRKS